ncbi:MAG: hypothetical protein Q8P50_01415 [Bacillota bacterium]|nr:hypothetical protein [Bacillota bacterium]
MSDSQLSAAEAVVVLGEAGPWPQEQEQVSPGLISRFVETMKPGCEALGVRLAGTLSAAAEAWPFGAQDWALRGHSVLSVPVLMGSVVARLTRGLSVSRVVIPATTTSLWPMVIPITPHLAVSIPAGTDRQALESLRSLFTGLPMRVTFNTLDETGSIVPDARSQLVLAELGLARTATGPHGTEWRLAHKPVATSTLRAIREWYAVTVETAASGLEPLVRSVGTDAPASAGLAALVAAGQTARAVPLPEVDKVRGGFLGRLARIIVGRGASVPGLTIWENPWSVWDFSVEMARGGGEPCSSEM